MFAISIHVRYFITLSIMITLNATVIMVMKKRTFVSLIHKTNSVNSTEFRIRTVTVYTAYSHKMSQCMRFPTMWYVRPAKPQISLRIP